MDPALVVFLVVVGVVAFFAGLAIFLFAFTTRRNNKHKKFVRDYSIALNKLLSINAKYKFHTIIHPYIYDSYDNEDVFLDMEEVDYLTYFLRDHDREVLIDISNCKSNKQLFDKYLSEIKGILPLGRYLVPTKGYDLNLLNRFEARYYNANVLKRPMTEFKMAVELRRTDLNGTIFQLRNKTFKEDEIQDIIDRLHNKRGDFYVDRGIWDSLCRAERSKVSNAIRFKIFARDGYCCKHCGKSGNDVRLEIDHIIPISKGGKSTMDNLQTLCHECNNRKGSDY